MHIAIMTAVGLAALAVFAAGGYAAGGNAGLVKAARVFIWLWLAAAIINGAFGLLFAGIPLLNEVAAFVPIFGVPAGLAWYLALRLGTRA
jgi:hypothetical protein